MKTRVYFFDLAIFAHTVAKSRSRRDVNRDTQSIVIQVTIIFRVSNQIHAHLDLFSKSKNSVLTFVNPATKTIKNKRKYTLDFDNRSYKSFSTN